MKKLKYLIALILLPFMIPTLVSAADSTIKITTPSTNFNAGNTITVNVTIKSSKPIGYYEYTLDYDTNKLKLLNSNSYIVNSTNNRTTKKVTKAFKFKINKSGNSKVTVSSYTVTSAGDEKNLSVNVSPLTIGTNSSNTNQTKNVYLKSLEVIGYELSPSFNKSITSYKISLDKEATKINIIAKAENDNYSIDGDGEYDVTGNGDTFDVTVSDTSGNKKTYTIKAEGSNSKDIKVKVDGKEYTLISDESKIDLPEGFIKKEITINKQKVTAFYNKLTDQTLVILKDSEGNIALYLYDQDKNTYTKYEVINFSKMSFIPIKTDKVLKGYHKSKVTIDENEIDCLKLSGNSEFSLIYGMNAKNGDKGWYTYESFSNTLQKYNDEIDSYYKERENSTKILIYILSGTSILFGILVIVLAVKLSQKKKRF